MLFLQRKENQVVTITTKSGEVIKIKYCGNRSPCCALLGFEAEKDIVILRDEAKCITPRE